MGNCDHGETGPVFRWSQLLENLDVFQDVDEQSQLLGNLAGGTGEGPRVLSFVNAHAANLIWEDATFWDNIRRSDVIVRDGIGMKLLMRLCGAEPGLNLNGTDLIPSLLDRMDRSQRIALYGTDEPWLGRGVKAIQNMGFTVVSHANGFLPDHLYVERVQMEQPQVVVLGMGMPKQERVALLLREALAGRNVLVINGGAVIDFLAGRFPRAPRWMRMFGLEWVYRLVREPRRLWRRYVVGNVRFLVRTVKVCYALR